MHRVGLQDDVIVNALRTRYHPLILTDADRATLRKAGVSDRVIVAMEDPYGIGIQNVRANMAAADSVAPPVAQTPEQKRADHPVIGPTLLRRSAPPPAAGGPASGNVYVGQSHPDASVAASRATPMPPAPASPTAPSAGSLATLALNPVPATKVPPEPIIKTVSQPVGPGVYLRHGSEWERVGGEPIYWHHRGHKQPEGWILRPASYNQNYPGGTDILVITEPGTSAIQYQLVRLHANAERRTFTPAPRVACT